MYQITLRRLVKIVKYRYSLYPYLFKKLMGKILNDFSLKKETPADFIISFRKHWKKALNNLQNGSAVLSWALHENDGRSREFRDFDRSAWERWLAWYKFHHFQWNRPSDARLCDMEKKLKVLGRKTWTNLFKRYILTVLDLHDLYSLPDVYYVIAALGRIPESVIDIGAGWGRLGMAWTAMGAKAIGITDAIEQSYVVQNQYLSSIPGVKFYELLDNNHELLDFRRTKGIIHFPFWQLPQIQSGSVEVISVVQVLREVNAECLQFLLQELNRILMKGGLFYVRDNDHEYREKCMHNINVPQWLVQNGFKQILKSDLIQAKDIHGVPRIYQKD